MPRPAITFFLWIFFGQVCYKYLQSTTRQFSLENMVFTKKNWYNLKSCCISLVLSFTLFHLRWNTSVHRLGIIFLSCSITSKPPGFILCIPLDHLSSLLRAKGLKWPLTLGSVKKQQFPPLGQLHPGGHLCGLKVQQSKYLGYQL